MTVDTTPRRGTFAELRRLAPYVRREAPRAGIVLGTSIGLALVDIPVPFCLKKVLDAVLAHHETANFFGRELAPRELLFAIFCGLVLLAAVKGLLLYGQRTVSETLGQRIVFALRLDLYRHLQSLSMAFFRNARTGRLMLRLMGDINAVLDMITDGFLRALTDSVTVFAVGAVILFLNWKLALIVMAGLPFYALTFIKLSPALRESGRAARAERSVFSGNLQEKIAGAAVVKAFGRERSEEGLIAEQTGRLRDRLIERARLGGRLAALAHVTVALGGALVLWIGGGAVLDGTMTKGGLMAFYALAAMLFPPLRRLARTNETYQAARVSLERILDFFDETESLRERPGAGELAVTGGAVRLRDVWFSYVPGTPVLKGIELDVAPGEVIALVGPNGAGKTTIAGLLTRFADPERGSVTIDGQDLRDVTLDSLRRNVGIVTQDSILFSGTVLDNIRYGRPDATEDEVREAARIANAWEFIEHLPDGLATEVGERGRRFSGGQVQRIALARIVLKNPPILVLDEATSAVDPESEALIQDAMRRLMQGRTTFVIAHRVTTIRNADRVIALDQGRIVETGTHLELLARRGLYARLFDEGELRTCIAG